MAAPRDSGESCGAGWELSVFSEVGEAEALGGLVFAFFADADGDENENRHGVGQHLEQRQQLHWR